MTATLDPAQMSFLQAAKVGYLATADAAGKPHVVPVCYAVTPQRIYIPVDEKPKRGDPRRLKRLRNISENPAVAFVVDRYDDRDWSRLGWLMIRGPAKILMPNDEHAMAAGLLRRRYEQYRQMALEQLPMIIVHVERLASWGWPGGNPPNVRPAGGNPAGP